MSKERMENNCIHCNGKGFNGLDRCTQCNSIDTVVQQAERANNPGIELELLNDEITRLEHQNKRYREELDILGEVINSAPNADKLNEEYERLKGLEGEE